MAVKWKRNLAKAHLEYLAEQADIEIVWLPKGWKSAAAFHQSRIVQIPVPWNRSLYLVALHELGHILSPMAVKLQFHAHHDAPDISTACEGAAWGWALGNTHPQLARNFLRTDLCDFEYGLIYHAQSLVRDRLKAAAKVGA